LLSCTIIIVISTLAMCIMQSPRVVMPIMLETSCQSMHIDLPM
jgi:hypothetical protein